MKKNGSDQQKPLRLWPGVILVLLQWIVRFIVPLIAPGAIAIGVFGGLLLGFAVFVWWIFFSRATRLDRWIAIPIMIAALVITSQFIHKSIATAMMGLMFTMYSIPVLCLAFVIWAVASQSLSTQLKRITMVAVIIVASGMWVLLRTDGMDGEIHQDLTWRWAATAEEKLLSKQSDITAKEIIDSTLVTKEAEWSGFRGNNRDNIIHGVNIGTQWDKTPPLELWRRNIGPGCSSFAVLGNLVYTQEQRGEYEMVSCYNLATGQPVWQHADSTRFWDSHAGAGPRSTPAIFKGRIYTLGATGIVNVLDAFTGKRFWSCNAVKNTEVKIPGWGYAGSPLVMDSLVFIAISGKLMAYNINSGQRRWASSYGGECYSSPHLFVSGNTKQILFANDEGITSYIPENGKKLWNFPLPSPGQIVQPTVVSANDLLVSAGETKGMKRLAIKNEGNGWKVSERWVTSDVKPYFNDVVVHKGCIFGFDGPFMVCADVEKGIRQWKGNRYAGEILLLADQDLLLVVTEKGDLALVSATPDKFTEIAKIPAVKGKTWNHPVLIGDILLVRNSQEMVAFKLPKAGS